MRISWLYRLWGLVVVLLVAGCMDVNEKSRDRKGSYPAPKEIISDKGLSIPVYDFNGLEYFLNRNDDTTYVLNFWASWCKPCIEEMPSFESLEQNFKNQKVRIILVSLDFKDRAKEDLIPFIIAQKIKSEVILLNAPDANAWIDKVNPEWTGSIPATLIYNQKQRKFVEGSFDPEELNNLVKSFLKS